MNKIKSSDSTLLLHKVDTIRKIANGKLNANIKAELGQFMTPSTTAAFMASLLPIPKDNKIYLLDPGSGVGSLTSAFLSRMKEWNTVNEVSIDAYEIDNIMLQYLRTNLESYRHETSLSNININYKIFYEDFITAASDKILKQEGLWSEEENKYTHCIMNPPYKKISSSSCHRKSLHAVGIETVNLYSGFVALALALLENNGYLVAIIPRSFCNGPYYKPFREYIIKNAAIRHIHLFDSRNKAFKDDKVLQENIIIMLEKNKKQTEVTISTSTDDSFTDLINNNYPFNQIVQPEDNEYFIHIPSSKIDKFFTKSKNISCSLNEIGIQVSTGPVVDFRQKKHLRQIYENDTVPLLYPIHFLAMKTNWPLENCKKPNAIVYTDETAKWLFPKGYYTVVRRFSSKEEKRRIVASVVNPENFKNIEYIGFENHLNVFHINRNGMSKELALGLAVFLNSKDVDDKFRRFSGHTQVNATDLRIMKYPNRETLIRLGEWAKEQKNITMEMINKQLEIIENGN